MSVTAASTKMPLTANDKCRVFWKFCGRKFRGGQKNEHCVGGVSPLRGSAIVATLSRGFTPTAMLFHPFGVRYVPIFPQVVEYFENRQQVVDDLGRKIRQQTIDDLLQ